jgi:hypothetical protein
LDGAHGLFSQFLVHLFEFHFQNAQENEDYSSIADVDALLLVAGDPISEEEPMRKGSCFQVDLKD